MQARKLGYSDLHLTTVGLGTWAIVGARRPSQIEETALAGDWALLEDDVAQIDALLAEREQALEQANG